FATGLALLVMAVAGAVAAGAVAAGAVVAAAAEAGPAAIIMATMMAEEARGFMVNSPYLAFGFEGEGRVDHGLAMIAAWQIASRDDKKRDRLRGRLGCKLANRLDRNSTRLNSSH